MVIGTYMMTNFDMQEIAPASSIIRNGRPTTDEIMHYVSTVWELPVHSTLPFFGKSSPEHKLVERLCSWIENFTRLSDRQNIRRDLPLPPLGR